MVMKMCILKQKGCYHECSYLWAFSAAYRVLKKPEYLEAATRAKEYVRDHFLDKEYGGVYWSVDYKGYPLDTKKQTYAIGLRSMVCLNMLVPQVIKKH